MSDQEQKTAGAPVKATLTFKEFLEKYPPDVAAVVVDRAAGPYSAGGGMNGHPYSFFRLNSPELDLHCEACGGARAFKFVGQQTAALRAGVVFDELDYACKNCKEGRPSEKRFCLAVIGEGKSGPVQKIGEYPAYSPVTSRKVFDLIGEDHRDMFLQGRRAELRGLGIGAYAYYRRIVDDQKDRIIDELTKVAKRLRASDDVLELFAEAKAEDQFTKAIKKIEDALPPALFIAEHNPLTILYGVLSDGIHDLSDAECLTHARTVRTLLIALADRMSEVAKDEAKSAEAIGAFLTRKQKKQESTDNFAKESN